MCDWKGSLISEPAPPPSGSPRAQLSARETHVYDSYTLRFCHQLHFIKIWKNCPSNTLFSGEQIHGMYYPKRLETHSPTCNKWTFFKKKGLHRMRSAGRSAGHCAARSWRAYFSSYFARTPARGPISVSVLTIISIYTSTTLSSLRVDRTCTMTLFVHSPTSRTLIEVFISTPLLFCVSAGPCFQRSDHFMHAL